MLIRANDNKLTITIESNEESISIETINNIIGVIAIDPQDNQVKFSTSNEIDGNSLILGENA